MANGTLVIKTFVSIANVPIPEAVVYITNSFGEKLAFDVTNKDGETEELTVTAPNGENSETPNANGSPFANVNVYVYKPNYYLIKAEDVQIFAQVKSILNIQMLPLPTHEQVDKLKTIIITPQPLQGEVE